MAPPINRQVDLKSRPSGIPQAENFEIAEAGCTTLPTGDSSRIPGSGLSRSSPSDY
jgi:hypothetical protein